ncbi:MAG: type I restriction endonuclease subunit R, partial [Defluviitaleaceae bacterium]|nr:type I restriction endonuclease subunit R [Defluviitaleaceae bacterium]
ADGIRDKNVLGFDPVMVETYKEKDIRKAVALKEVKVQTEEEVFEDENKTKVYLKFLNEMQMGDEKGDDGKKIKGIESYLKNSQYSFETSHPQMVVTDIKENWTTLSQNGKFHSIFATNSIPDAIEYYRLFKKEAPKLKITALFDPNIDNLENTKFKEDGLVEIIEDYNEAYNQDFKINAHDKFKKDIAARLAHKKPYSTIDKTKDAQIDILIVVDQMLTGFDSKWINTLYMDKVLEHANIIQAFSRTNRLLGYEKPFGTIKYYRKPHTMQKNIEAALKLYSGDKPYDMFVPKLGENIKKINEVFVQIKEIFETSGVDDFKILPSEQAEKIKFAQLFVEISDLLEAAKIQGHKWEQAEYEYKDENITLVLDETTYNVLLLRYKELFESEQESDYEQTEKIINIPYEISGYLTNKNTGRIDTEWLNSRFTKYLKCLENANDSETKQALNELHKTFKTLAKTEQDFAEIIIRDIQSGDFVVQEGNTLRDYITIYQANAKDDEINLIIKTFGLDEKMFREMILLNITKENINDFGRFDNLLSTVNKQQAKKYFEQKIGENLSPLKINGRVREFLEFFCYGRRIGIYHLRVFYQ